MFLHGRQALASLPKHAAGSHCNPVRIHLVSYRPIIPVRILMNLDFIIWHISLPPWFRVIHKFDKPAFKLLTNPYTEERNSGPEAQLWVVTPSCGPDADAQPALPVPPIKIGAFVLLEPTHKRTVCSTSTVSPGTHLPGPPGYYIKCSPTNLQARRKLKHWALDSNSHTG